jgi:hypothetical protein
MDPKTRVPSWCDGTGTSGATPMTGRANRPMFFVRSPLIVQVSPRFVDLKKRSAPV